MQTKIAIVVQGDNKLHYFTTQARGELSTDPTEAMLFTNGTEAVEWATERDLYLDHAWTLARVTVSGQIQVSLVNVF